MTAAAASAADAQAGAGAGAAHARDELERLGVPILGELPEGAYADGGDRFWIDDDLMAIGLGYRTNRAGAAAVAAISGVAVEAYDTPHDQGPAHVLHLQSFISAVDRRAVRGLRAARARARCSRTCASAAGAGSRSTARATTRWAATSSPSARASW